MITLERLAILTGSVLLGISAVLIWDRKKIPLDQLIGEGNDNSVEQLAENLKQAWADHHTP